MNSDFVPIGQASKILGVSIQTLRNWEKTGRLLPDFVSAGRTRRYSRRRLLSIAGLTNSETNEFSHARERCSHRCERLKNLVVH